MTWISHDVRPGIRIDDTSDDGEGCDRCIIAKWPFEGHGWHELTTDCDDSYRRYICKSNKDAESASWIRFRRAAKREIYKKMYAFEAYCDAELLGNHQKVDSYHIEASIADSET